MTGRTLPGMADESRPREDALVKSGTKAFQNTILALFCAGFATFALLYYVQPLLPVFSERFGLGAAQASLALSVTTGLMAPAMLVAGAISETLGRKPVMVASVLASALLTLATGFAPSWPALLALRAAAGISIAGLPAVAMAYVAEEIAPPSIGLAMGLYIGGSALGGMAARLAAGLLADLGSWRWATLALGAMGIIAGLIFGRSLPPSRHFSKRPWSARALATGFLAHLREPGLRLLVLEGFLIMGSFVSIYNYIGYRLLAPPFGLSPTGVGLVFSLYLVGIVSSPVTGVGGDAARLAQCVLGHDRRHGRGRRAHALRLASCHHRRHRGLDLRLLRRAFDRQRLGRTKGANREGASRVALSLSLLCRLERDRLAERHFLGEKRLERCGRRSSRCSSPLPSSSRFASRVSNRSPLDLPRLFPGASRSLGSMLPIPGLRPS